MKTSLELAILEASHELKLPSELVERVYRTYWYSIKLIILDLPLKEDLKSEDFLKLKTSINIPSLGKLYSNYDRVLGSRKKFKYLQQIKNNDLNKETLADVY